MEPEELGAYYELILDEESRKAEGIYYTPQYIVDYIVENTLGKLLEGKTLEEVADIRIFDTSCVAGVFLLSAYQYLLDWYEKHCGKLTMVQRCNILTNNIFGVDIDPLAVEITKYCLSMKCSEGNDFSLGLDGNICCGNSLIESDFYTDKDMALWSSKDMRKINAFDWKKAFPAIIKSGGFDIVIGNPPWGQKAAKFSTDEKEYYLEKYPAASVGIADLSRFFIERSIQLLNPDGFWGQVLPDIILLKNYETTRGFLLDNMTLSTIDHWGKAFSQVNIEACTITGTKGRGRKNHSVKIGIHKKGEITLKRKIRQGTFSELPGKKFNLFLTDAAWSLLKKLSEKHTFGQFFDVHEGIHTGNVRDKLFVDKKINAKCKKLIFGRDEVKRYYLAWAGKWVHYTKDHFGKKDYAGLGKPEHFECAKLIIRRTGDYVLACLDEKGYYFSNNAFVCIPKDESVDMRVFLGILNSRLLTWYYRTVQPRVGKMFAEIKINLISDFPMPFRGSLSALQKKSCQRLVELVNQMLAAHVEYRKSPWEFNRKRIDVIDAQIDRAVYELYGFTTEEIAIVEGDT
jgi:hypothetical protein